MPGKRIAVGGSAANPPHIGHYVLVNTLLASRRFDQVIWIPSGVRVEKPDFVSPDHRVAMTLLTFPSKWFWEPQTVFMINFGDVYGENTATIDHLERLQQLNPDAEITWFTGVDSVMPDEKFGGKCEIEATWKRGGELLKHWRFLILSRPEFPDPYKLDLPSQFEVLDAPQIGTTSTLVREKVLKGEPFEHLVSPGVAAYIKRHSLYGWKGGTR